MANDFVEGAEGQGDPFDPKDMAILEDKIVKGEDDFSAKQKAYLNERKRAYSNVFTPGKRTQADINFVLNDLQYFCKVWVPTYDIKDGEHAAELSKRKEGRREVFQRIKDFTKLDSDSLFVKYTASITKPQ